MYKYLVLLICIFRISTAQAQVSFGCNCYNDSLILSSNTSWKIMDNSFGVPLGTPATIVNTQINNYPQYPNALWVSTQLSWTILTNVNAPDDSAVFVKEFKICQLDTVIIDLNIRRDNYCNVYLDGNLLFTEPAAWNPNTYNIGDNILDTFILQPCTHKIEVVAYNRNAFTGANGYGFILGGLIKAKASTLMIGQAPACDSINCCVGGGVLPAPIININGAGAYCQGSTAALTASGGAFYNWSGGISNGNNFNVAGSNIYTVTVNDNYGCTVTQTAAITLLPSPTLTVPQNIDICTGSTATINALSNTNILTWQPPIGLNTTTGPTVIVNAANTVYTVTATNSQCSTSTSINITEILLPVANAGPDQSICSNATVQLSGSGLGSYLWFGNNINNPNIANPVASPINNTSYTLVVNSALNCNDTDVVNINVNPLPILSISSSNNAGCAGNSIALNATGANNYNWLVGTTIVGTGSSIQVSPAATTTYVVVGTDANNCTGSATQTISIFNPPAISIFGDKILCPGDSSNLVASGGNNFTWSPNLYMSNTSGNSVIVYPPTNTTYTIQGTDANGCIASTTQLIEVLSYPSLGATSSNNITCNTVSSNLFMPLAQSYSWSPSNSLSNSLIANPIASPEVNTTYYVIASNGDCSVIDSVKVIVEEVSLNKLFIPNSFTPNGDDLNKCFKIANTFSFSLYSLKIFNRWGQCIFETKDPNECWYGETNLKDNSTTETYFYKLTGTTECGKIDKQGDILILK
jgi:gliding motility-associated-like protein